MGGGRGKAKVQRFQKTIALEEGIKLVLRRAGVVDSTLFPSSPFLHPPLLFFFALDTLPLDSEDIWRRAGTLTGQPSTSKADGF